MNADAQLGQHVRFRIEGDDNANLLSDRHRNLPGSTAKIEHPIMGRQRQPTYHLIE